MSGSVLFGRKVSFEAFHHYELKGKSASENRALFGPAAETHLHQWELTVWLKGDVDPVTGMAVDLVLVDKILKEDVLEPFSGKHFNKADVFFEDHQPTTEVLAQFFAARLAPKFLPVELVRLRIAECDELFSEWVA